MDSLRWLLLRDMAVFKPDHHRLVVCERNLDLEVIEGKKERRNRFVIDSFTGKSWGRRGTGEYVRWSTVPPAGMMLDIKNHRPKPDSHIILSCSIPHYHGIRIGRLHAESTQLMFQVFSDISSDWVAIPNSYIEGWLALP